MLRELVQAIGIPLALLLLAVLVLVAIALLALLLLVAGLVRFVRALFGAGAGAVNKAARLPRR